MLWHWKPHRSYGVPLLNTGTLPSCLIGGGAFKDSGCLSVLTCHRSSTLQFRLSRGVFFWCSRQHALVSIWCRRVTLQGNTEHASLPCFFSPKKGCHFCGVYMCNLGALAGYVFRRYTSRLHLASFSLKTALPCRRISHRFPGYKP